MQQSIFDGSEFVEFVGFNPKNALRNNDLFVDLLSPSALQIDQGLVVTGQFIISFKLRF